MVEQRNKHHGGLIITIKSEGTINRQQFDLPGENGHISVWGCRVTSSEMEVEPACH